MNYTAYELSSSLFNKKTVHEANMGKVFFNGVCPPYVVFDYPIVGSFGYFIRFFLNGNSVPVFNTILFRVNT